MCILRYSILLFFLCGTLHAQQKTPAAYPKKQTGNRNEPLEDSFLRLGRTIEKKCEELASKLENERVWQNLGLQIAELGDNLAKLGEPSPPPCIEYTPSDSICIGQCVGQSSSGAYERTKKFSKSFRLAAGKQFAVENKFGKVHINTWDKPEASVEVIIIARSSSESKAQNMLDRISIAVEEGTAEILVRTQFNEATNWMGGKQSFEINYVVNMPRNNPLRVKNSFGDTYVAELNGKSEISASYGNLKIDRLLNTENYVKIAFGSGRIGYCKAGTVKLSYSEMEITDGGTLTIESSYSDLEIKNIQSVQLQTKYGDISIAINDRGFKGLDIDGSFSSIDLRVPAHQNFDFEIKTSYADLNVDESKIPPSSMQVQKTGSSRTCTGTFGKSSISMIKVTSRYGDINLKFK